jgi:hypothetical protein
MASELGGAYHGRVWWKKKPEPPLRDQLLAARADLARQIEILEAGPSSIGKGGEFIDNGALISDLRAQLGQVEKALAEA